MKKSDKPMTDTPPAVAEAESVLAKANQFVNALQETHSTIPAALSEETRLASRLGAASITGSGDADQLHALLSAARERREGDVRRRHAAAEGLLTLEGELGRAHAGVESARTEIATSVLAEFMTRWNSGCQQLAALHAEGIALGTALHTRVNCPAPYVVTQNVVNSRPELRFALSPDQVQPVALSPELNAVVNMLIRLSTVLTMIGGIRSSQQMDERSFQLNLRRGLPPAAGVYRVLQGFTCLTDGLTFEPTTLIDASLVGSGTLSRLLQSVRYLRPVELESAVA